jgi:hypothetical protein
MRSLLTITRLLTSTSILFLASTIQAAPVWVFTPLTPTTISVPANGSAYVAYTVTNNSQISHTLLMKPIPGITASGNCSSPINYHQSCTLNLQISGSALQGKVIGGPALCQDGDLLQCYQPNKANSLNISRTPAQNATLQVLPTTVDLVAGSGIAEAVTLTNASQVDATGIMVKIRSQYGVTLQSSGTTCGTTLMANTSCTYYFLPGPRAETATATISSNDVLTPAIVTINVGAIADVTLSSSVSNLGLSVKGSGALLGTARQITITNTDTTKTAFVVSYDSTSLPSGTTITSSPSPACGDIAPLGTCVLTITPGTTPSAPPYDANPIPITLNIEGENTNPLSIPVNIITYGSVYQSGYVFSIDDTTPNTGSVGGKAAALVNQAEAYPNGIIWSSKGNGSTAADVSNIAILGIDNSSTTSVPSPTSPAYPVGTPPFTACNGKSDGACDTQNIVSYYNANRQAGGSAPTPLNYYAAGLCVSYTGGGFINWYLPAICEIGPSSGGPGCPAGQTILTNLPNLLTGYYWSSTENTTQPQNLVWVELFSGSTGSQQVFNKDFLLGVRCTRSLT